MSQRAEMNDPSIRGEGEGGVLASSWPIQEQSALVRGFCLFDVATVYPSINIIPTIGVEPPQPNPRSVLVRGPQYIFLKFIITDYFYSGESGFLFNVYLYDFIVLPG